ncbi:MAG: hypothetical protein EB101_04380 [Chitinophagia bacterium]|nr:hypothetical protein [Chitinophagia bacterium]
MFTGRRLLVATKHKKERVLSPLLETALGVQCFTDDRLDTDLLGTFTGEIERVDDPLTTARKKIEWGMELTGCDLAVASEGSFGPHPTLLFVPANEELVLFVDKKNNIEVVGRSVSTETNFSGGMVSTQEELRDFARRVQFPSHALIVREGAKSMGAVVKGITSWKQLEEHTGKLFEKQGQAYVETDMRALYNPSRMKVIAKAAEQLVGKLGSHCPQCGCPGFSVTDVVAGLPCMLCASPTRSTLYYTYRCQHCSFDKKEEFPSGKKNEDPQYCDHCNP